MPGAFIRVLEQCRNADDSANSTTNFLTQQTRQTDNQTENQEASKSFVQANRARNPSDQEGNGNSDSRLSLLTYCSPLPLRSPFSVLTSKQNEPPPVIIELEQIR